MEGHHEAIIPPSQFDFVQAEFARRKKNGRYSGVNVFASRIKCGCCGGWYGAKVWHSNDKYRKVVYRCNKKYNKGGEPCDTPSYTEEEIKQIFLKALNIILTKKTEIIEILQKRRDTSCQTESLISEKNQLSEELTVIADNLERTIRENASMALEQSKQKEKEIQLQNLHEEKYRRFHELDVLIQERNSSREVINTFIMALNRIEGKQTEFKEELWGILVEYIRINKMSSTVVFRGGIEITI